MQNFYSDFWFQDLTAISYTNFLKIASKNAVWREFDFELAVFESVV